MTPEERAAHQRELNRAAVSRYRAAHPAKIAAAKREGAKTPSARAAKSAQRALDRASGKLAGRDAVRRAIEAGTMVRKPCMVCGDPVVHAHHWRGYNGDARLDVQWLCVLHHAKAHRQAVAA